MMTTSSNLPFGGRRRRPRALRVVLWLFLGAVIAGALFFRQAAAGVLWQALRPVISLRDALGANEAGALRAELASSSAALSDRDLLYQENIELKGRLGRDPGRTRILAGIIARPPASSYGTLIIDAGSVEGVAAGDLVAAAGTALIGEVAEAYAHTARVRLFSAPGEEHQGLLMHAGVDGGVPLTLIGQGGGSMSAEVPSGTEAAVGDSIQIPGVGGGLIAKVAALDAREGESFIHVYVTLPANPLALRFVEVWKP